MVGRNTFVEEKTIFLCVFNRCSNICMYTHTHTHDVKGIHSIPLVVVVVVCVCVCVWKCYGVCMCVLSLLIVIS